MADIQIKPTILSEDDRVLFREQLDNSSAVIQRLGEVVASIHGKAARQIVSVTIKFQPDSQKPVTPERKRTGIHCCATYDDGTCGCVDDPPGISYPC